jgi:hypothetical protein
MARRGVDYSQGYSGAIATQYADLRAALASEGEARNRQKAREIEDKGLFGTGIRQSDVEGFASIAMKGAEFGESRMGRKMDRATKSFDRRMKADERRAATLQGRHDKGQLTEAGIAELDGLQFGMKERRDSFEDFMGKYQEKGLWGTKFGGKDVGYRTEGESKWSKDERSKVAAKEPVPIPPDPVPSEPGSNKFDDLGGGPPDRYSSYPHSREFEKTASESEIEKERRGQAEDMKKRLNFGGISERISNIPAGERARQQTKFGRSEWEDKHGRGTFDPKGMMNMEPLDFTNDYLSDEEKRRLKLQGYNVR